MAICIIAALGRNREIGKRGGLLWKIPADMKHFKETTMGKTVIMGRKTFLSIGRPLPGRQNIVLTRNEELPAPPGVTIVHSLESAIAVARASHSEGNSKDIFIIGGSEIYTEGLSVADRLYLTLIDAKDEAADTFFPEYEDLFPFVAVESLRQEEQLRYRFVTLTRGATK